MWFLQLIYAVTYFSSFLDVFDSILMRNLGPINLNYYFKKNVYVMHYYNH